MLNLNDSNMFKTDLEISEYDSYYNTYIGLVTLDAISELKNNLTEDLIFLESIDPQKHHYAYAKNKWTVLQLIQHCIDTERVFQYRALCIARGEKQNIPGFDENKYADSTKPETLSYKQVIKEFQSVRQSTVLLFESMQPKNLNMIGTANQSPLSPRACAFIIAGHWKYHLKIIKERYLADEK
ncbi:MAG: DinB family protein [Flavobacteriales bacterium]